MTTGDDDSGATKVVRSKDAMSSNSKNAQNAKMAARFGREVRRQREARGMTLQILAKRSGLTANFIGTVENGKRNPSLSTVFSLSRGVGVKPGELLAESTDQSAAAGEAGRLVDKAPIEVQMAILTILNATTKKRRS
jgi:transcriptional regulator with XRE-family HTH domain